jgi:hypothetical protein
LRLDHRAHGAPPRVGLEVQDLGLQQDLVEQFGDVRPALRRDLLRQHLPAELLEHDVVREELLLHPLRVRLRQVDLIDRHDDRHARVARV